ncbi:hypothetical protein ACFQRC_09670 [Enterovirga sp. GCM10030262]|uniref:hypothetical protein n=1 Tax=Enterovirga sp. GCM10030262 TaxID=3273391 RepID=UPI0036144B9D
MQFLKTLFWVAMAVILVLFASVNWNAVTVTLWGGLQADVKLPILILASFLLGFLPMLVVHRARSWTLKRRLDMYERQTAVAQPPAVAPIPVAPLPDAPLPAADDRTATDSKVWPKA